MGISALLAIVAFVRATAPAGHYDGQVYGMRATTHRRYGAVAIVLALAFVASFAWPALPAIPILAVTVLVALLYFTSFLRGAEADD